MAVWNLHRPFLQTIGVSLLTMVLLTPTTHAKLFKYSEDDPHILLEIHFAVELRAVKDGEIINKEITLDPSNVSDHVTGEWNDTNARMNLIFPNDVTWAYIFEKKPDDSVTFDRFIKIVPSETFQDTSTINDTETHYLYKPGVKHILNSSMNSYKCDKGDTYEYPDQTEPNGEIEYFAEITEFDIHLQAFNVENGKFSHPERCPNDIIPTSPTPTSTESPGPDKRFVVYNGSLVCISFEGTLTITLDYATPDGKNTMSVQIHENAKSSGNCSLTPSSQNLIISFFEGWSLTVVFSTDYAKEDTLTTDLDDVPYSISSVTLDYITDDEGYPCFACPAGSQVNSVSSNAKQEQAFPKTSSGAEYFKCAGDFILKLNKSVTISIKDLKFKAFKEDNDANFAGRAIECSVNNQDSHNILLTVVLPIVGGVVIVISGSALVTLIIRRKGRCRTVPPENDPNFPPDKDPDHQEFSNSYHLIKHGPDID